MFTRSKAQALDADCRGDHGRSRGESLQNFQTRAAANAQRHDQHSRGVQVAPHVRYVRVQFDSRPLGDLLSQLLGRLAADDRERHLRLCCLDSGQDSIE